MCRKYVFLALLAVLFTGTAQAQWISAVAQRNTDTDAPELPQISPTPMAEDALVFTDRTHQYNDIPANLLGAQIVLTNNDNKNQSAYELDVTFSANATLYVFVDNRMGGSPGGKGVLPVITGMAWLANMGFVDTGDDIGIDESGDGTINQYSSIFSLSVKAGTTVTVHGNTEGHGGNMLSVAALGPKLAAYNPNPANGEKYLETWANLSWTAGDTAASHDVYIGETFEDVNSGAAGTFRGNVASAFFTIGFFGFPYPDGLVPGTTYYWRVDEVEANGTAKHKGPVWSFWIPPRTAYFPNPADGAGSVAVNASLSWTPGFGAKLHTVYFGDNFDDVNNATGGALAGTTTYNPGPLKSAKVYFWRVDESNPPNLYKGQVWSFATLGAVGNPHPSNGASSTEMNAILTWTPSDNAASHQLYFGTDKEAVRKAGTTSPEYKGVKALGAESYDPGLLAWDSTYYWRVDEVNNVNANSPWKGPLWSFTTGNYVLVEDFESYNDIDPPGPGSNRIFDKWIDGFGTTTNGAVVGNNLPPYAGRTIIHGGAQSMPLSYNNNLKFSEATLTLAAGRDWTREGVANLSLWFRGAATNAAERMYVALNGTAVVYHTDPAAVQATAWTPWVIPLQQFAGLGVNLTNVTSITVGFGTRGNTTTAGGTGQMYIDDIRLYRP